VHLTVAAPSSFVAVDVVAAADRSDMARSTAELTAHMTGIFRSLTRAEQDQWLEDNGLARKPGMNESQNQLVLTPNRGEVSPRSPPGYSPRKWASRTGTFGASGTLGATMSPSRAKQALRLVENPDAEIPRLPLLNVSGVRFTDAELKQWFAELDKHNNGWLSKDEFRAMYRQLENYGTPVRESYINEQLKKMKSVGDDRITFDEFALLVSHVAAR
jgi:hypothetical protein